MAEVEFNEKYSEIFKLHEMLLIDGITHELIDESAYGYMGAVQYRFSLYYPSKEEMKCCVSEGLWTYGGRLNKLELSGLLTEEEERNDENEKNSKVGYLSAENIFERIPYCDNAYKKAYAVVMTGESALYANVILKKGVVKE